MKTPLLHTNHVLRGTETHRIFLAVYHRKPDGTWEPWAAYTLRTEEKREWEDEPRINEHFHYQEWAFEYSKAAQVTLYYNPGGGGGIPRLSDLIRGAECGVYIDTDAFIGLRAGDGWPEESKQKIGGILIEYADRNPLPGVTYFDEPPGLNGGTVTNPFDNGEGYECNEGRTIYCSICKDHLNDDTDNPCEHIQWCERCQQQTGLGLVEGDRCACGPNGVCDLCEKSLAEGEQLYSCDKCDADVCTACSHNHEMGVHCDNCVHDD